MFPSSQDSPVSVREQSNPSKNRVTTINDNMQRAANIAEAVAEVLELLEYMWQDLARLWGLSEDTINHTAAWCRDEDWVSLDDYIQEAVKTNPDFCKELMAASLRICGRPDLIARLPDF